MGAVGDLRTGLALGSGRELKQGGCNCSGLQRMLIELGLLDGEHQRFLRTPFACPAWRSSLSENLQDGDNEGALQTVALALDVRGVAAAMDNLHLRPWLW